MVSADYSTIHALTFILLLCSTKLCLNVKSLEYMQMYSHIESIVVAIVIFSFKEDKTFLIPFLIYTPNMPKRWNSWCYNTTPLFLISNTKCFPGHTTDYMFSFQMLLFYPKNFSAFEKENEGLRSNTVKGFVS